MNKQLSRIVFAQGNEARNAPGNRQARKAHAYAALVRHGRRDAFRFEMLRFTYETRRAFGRRIAEKNCCTGLASTRPLISLRPPTHRSRRPKVKRRGLETQHQSSAWIGFADLNVYRCFARCKLRWLDDDETSVSLSNSRHDTPNRCAPAFLLRANDGQARHPDPAGRARRRRRADPLPRGRRLRTGGFIAEIEPAYANLAAHSNIGSAPPRYAYELDIPGLCSWSLDRYPDLIFYIERKDHVEVWRVLDGKRDIPAWLLSNASEFH